MAENTSFVVVPVSSQWITGWTGTSSGVHVQKLLGTISTLPDSTCKKTSKGPSLKPVLYLYSIDLIKFRPDNCDNFHDAVSNIQLSRPGNFRGVKYNWKQQTFETEVIVLQCV